MRVAIVNDMTMARETLRRLVEGMPGYRVAWVANDGRDAVAQCKKEIPDLILMDLFMPIMDGVEASRKIMAQTPCPILVVTAAADGHAKVLDALGAGAVDAVQTPGFAMVGQPAGADRLKFKIMSLCRRVTEGGAKTHEPPKKSRRLEAAHSFPLIAIGASAGGPAALSTIFSALPGDFSAAIVVVQHIDAQFAPLMANWLAEKTALKVRTVNAQDHPQVGTVLIASTTEHLAFIDHSSLGYVANPRDSHYRPSVDVFFESVANLWDGDVMGVLLTGMGRDGAKGLKSLRDAGANTIAQDSGSCVVYGMPKAAVELNAAMEVLPLDRIAASLIDFVKLKKQGICI